MPKHCSVPNCSRSGKGHVFPKNPEIRKKWVIAIKREHPTLTGRLWEPTKFSCVCAAHFTPDDYRSTYSDTRKFLKANAVPSVFPFASPSVAQEIMRDSRRAQPV